MASIARTSRRRLLLVGLVGVVASACRELAPRADPPPVAPNATMDGWRSQGQAMVGDALVALRTLDEFAAYRISATPSSGLRSQATLAWDPPTGAAWDFATHVSRGLHDRANQLFQAITTTTLDPALWRSQRTMADAAHDVIALGDALQAYRDRIDRLPPGDASGALGQLDRAWTQWDVVAAHWELSRSELIACLDHAGAS